MQRVEAVREGLTIPTYGVGVPDRNPIYFPSRVYQGSCGDVYPIPFIDKVHDKAEDKTYDTVRMESEYLRVVLMPEIGGRIFLGQDKANADYDFFYRQDVIKPALVGLAGPWISGGVEFNWPQHHRPGTFMPTDLAIEEESDGSATVWMGEHDVISHLKVLYGIRVRPGSSLLELRARVFNRTALTKTFMWWANPCARVHNNYQSFFPPDVHYVADHAVRDMSSFPIADGTYYGIDYGQRPGANDLSWYRNIPVPTSYMVCETDFNFFGGYDYDAEGGFVHVADRHIAPGKKQWTWGNSEFGWAWDRELTDANGPYVELMAGIYTDNQPDFSYLLPYETKTFSQFWWPYKELGPVQNANRDAALRLVVESDRRIDAGVAVSREIDGARIVLMDGDRKLVDERVDLAPDTPWRAEGLTLAGDDERRLLLELLDAGGKSLISFRPVDRSELERNRDVATEPAAPQEIESNDELYLTGEHLEQYRHPTRSPEPYWQEALRRDEGDSRTLVALGRRWLEQGRFAESAELFERAVRRLTHRHPNPYTGEAHYYLGLACRFQDRMEDAYGAFYKSIWNYEWRSPGYYGLASIDCLKEDYETALEHLELSLDTNRQNSKALVLKAAILRKTGRSEEGLRIIEELLASDPLDHWARYELAQNKQDFKDFLNACRNNAQTILDLAYDYSDAGMLAEAISLLELHQGEPVPDSAVPEPMARTVMTRYALAWMQWRGGVEAWEASLAKARASAPDYFFPARLQSQIVLEWAIAQDGADRNAAFALGNYLYARQRREEAIAAWERARDADPKFPTALRNLGIAYWNVHRDGAAARAAYEQALASDSEDARILFEYDQLRKKLNDDPQDRLEFLEARRAIVAERDDCSVELATLYNLTGQPAKALELLESRRFHPWEGGEGKVLRQYTAARILLGRQALDDGDGETALDHFSKALDTPDDLGEAYHPLQAKADVNYWIGRALKELGRNEEASWNFDMSAKEDGDFEQMAVTAHSEISYYRGLSLRELGNEEQACQLFEDLKTYAENRLVEPAKIDYFATSLPMLLVFEDDLEKRHNWEATYLLGLAEAGLGARSKSKEHFKDVLRSFAAHPDAGKQLERQE